MSDAYFTMEKQNAIIFISTPEFRTVTSRALTLKEFFGD